MGFLVHEGYDEYVKQLKSMGPRGGMKYVSYERNGSGELGDWFDDKPEDRIKPWDDGGLYDFNNDVSYYSYVVHPDFSINVYKWGEHVVSIKQKNYLEWIFDDRRDFR